MILSMFTWPVRLPTDTLCFWYMLSTVFTFWIIITTRFTTNILIFKMGKIRFQHETLFLSIIPTCLLSSLPPPSSSCGLYWGWPLQGWSAQGETPPHCPRSRYSPAHNDICALDGAVFAYLLPKILDDACNKLLSNLWTGRCLPLVEGNSLVLQFLKRWKNVQCLFSPCNACCEMTSG